MGTILCAVIPNDYNILNPRFLHLYLHHNKDKVLVPLMRGAANVSLSVKDIKNVEIPLPPINIQNSIIDRFEKIDQDIDQINIEINVYSIPQHTSILMRIFLITQYSG